MVVCQIISMHNGRIERPRAAGHEVRSNPWLCGPSQASPGSDLLNSTRPAGAANGIAPSAILLQSSPFAFVVKRARPSLSTYLTIAVALSKLHQLDIQIDWHVSFAFRVAPQTILLRWLSLNHRSDEGRQVQSPGGVERALAGDRMYASPRNSKSWGKYRRTTVMLSITNKVLAVLTTLSVLYCPAHFAALPFSSSIRRSGWLVMIPSTPRDITFSISAGVFTVQAWTWSPAARARRMFFSLRFLNEELIAG